MLPCEHSLYIDLELMNNQIKQDFIIALQAGKLAQIERLCMQSPELINTTFIVEDDQTFALIVAVQTNNLELTKLLVTLKANVDKHVSEHNRETALLCALRYGASEEIIDFLLVNKANANHITDDAGETPLTVALEYQASVKTIGLLLKYGANANCPYNSRPLTIALKTASAEAVKLLLKYGAEVNYIERAEYSTPLCTALQYENSPETIQLLLEHGDNVHYTNKFGNACSLLLIAGQNNASINTIEVLLKYGADPYQAYQHQPSFFDHQSISEKLKQQVQSSLRELLQSVEKNLSLTRPENISKEAWEKELHFILYNQFFLDQHKIFTDQGQSFAGALQKVFPQLNQDVVRLIVDQIRFNKLVSRCTDSTNIQIQEHARQTHQPARAVSERMINALLLMQFQREKKRVSWPSVPPLLSSI